MRPTLEKILLFSVISGLFASALIPLIVVPSMYQPYASQGFAFRILVELTAGAWFILAAVNDTFRPRRSWVLGTFAVFVAVMAIADALGVDPFASFWSSYQRMDGWITLIHVFVYMVIAASVLSSEEKWQRLFQISLGISVIVSLYGFLQLARVPGIVDRWQAGSGMRIDATMGNPDFLGSYLLLNIFIATLLFARSYKRTSGSAWSLELFAYLSVLVVDIVALFLSGTRGAVLGLICGGIVSLVILAFFHDSRKIRRIAAASILFIPLSLFGLLSIVSTTSFVHNNGLLTRFAPSSLDINSVGERLVMDEMAWTGFMDRPILGWGQENFSDVSFKHFYPGLSADYMINTRVHNILLEELVDGGILGLVSYLSIIAATLLALWRKRRFPIVEASILTGLLCGYFVQNLSLFDTVVSYMLFATILAYIAHKEMGDAYIFPITTLRTASLPYLTASVLIVSLGIVWVVNANALFANELLFRALAVSQNGSQEQLEYFKQAISLGSMGTGEAIHELAKVTTLLSQNQAVDDKTKQAFVTYTVQQLLLHAKEHPVDQLGAAEIYGEYGDNTNYQQALLGSLKESPNNYFILSDLINNAAQQGDAVSAFKYMGAIYNMAPDNQDLRVAYATLAIAVNNIDLSDKLLAPVIANGSVNNTPLIQAYLVQGHPEKIVDLLQPYMQAHPDDSKAGLSLAAAYYIISNKEKAIQTLQALAGAQPSAQSEANTFISQIETGSVPHDYLTSKFAESN